MLRQHSGWFTAAVGCHNQTNPEVDTPLNRINQSTEGGAGGQMSDNTDYEALLAEMRTYAMGKVPADEVDDIAAEAVAKTWEAQPEDPFAYAQACAVNAVNYYYNSAQGEDLSELIAGNLVAMDEAIVFYETFERASQHSMDRELLELLMAAEYGEGQQLAHGEAERIAAELGINPVGLRKRIARMRRRMNDFLLE